MLSQGAPKKDLALKYGAEAFIDFREEKDIAARVKEISDGIGAHAVFVTAWQSYKDAINYLGDRVGGKVVAIGIPPTEQNVILGAPPLPLILKKQGFVGTVVGTVSLPLPFRQLPLARRSCSLALKGRILVVSC